jgi:hypothetical protein
LTSYITDGAANRGDGGGEASLLESELVNELGEHHPRSKRFQVSDTEETYSTLRNTREFTGGETCNDSESDD